jgi:hypothetical protein
MLDQSGLFQTKINPTLENMHLVDMHEAGAASPHIEPRWPVLLTIIVEVFLLGALPGRVKTLPTWGMPTLLVVTILPMAVVTVSAKKSRWLRIENIILLLFLFFSACVLLDSLGFLLSAMLRPKAPVSGVQLLESSIAAWTGNLLICSLVYWRVDRGGPESRCNDLSTEPDWLFPQEGAVERAPQNWRPTYVDYLFLSFCTSTAFSPTDVLPLTSRAKLLMMAESTISLVTIIAIAARAINILNL